MDLLTVKLCFEKYIMYLKNQENVIIADYDINTISIQEIDKLTQTTFTDYVISCKDKVNHQSVTCTLYKHIHTLIRQYIQDNTPKIIEQLNNHIAILEAENNSLKTPTENKEIPKSGWFFK